MQQQPKIGNNPNNPKSGKWLCDCRPTEWNIVRRSIRGSEQNALPRIPVLETGVPTSTNGPSGTAGNEQTEVRAPLGWGGGLP